MVESTDSERRAQQTLDVARPRVCVAMPAYNAARTLERTCRDLPEDAVDDRILVDDASQDETRALAHHLGLHVLAHTANRGYGASQKTCYAEALRRGADIIVLLHPDFQYDPTRIPALVAPLLRGDADLVLGSRFLPPSSALAGHMPLWRYTANRCLTWIENRAFGQRLSECHTGFRAYSRRFLLATPFQRNSNDFVFDSQMLAQAVCGGFRIAEIPISTRYGAGSSSISFRRATVYGVRTLGVVLCYLLHRWGVRREPIFISEGPESP